MKVLALVTAHETKIYEIEPEGKAKSAHVEEVSQEDRDGFRHHIITYMQKLIFSQNISKDNVLQSTQITCTISQKH